MRLEQKQSFNIPWLAVIGLVIGIFISGSEELVISALLLDLASSFHSTVDIVAYSISIFGIAVIVGAPLIALVEDRFSRSTTLLLGMGLFIVGTVICALATSIHVFFIGRAFSGLAAGAFIPMAYAFVGDFIPEKVRGNVMGLIVSSWSLSLVLGVPIGALIGEWYNWRWVFLFFVFLGMVVIVLILLDLKINQREKSITVELKEERQSLFNSFSSAFRTPYVPSLIIITFCNMLGFYGMYSYFGSFVRATFSSGSGFAGMMVIMYGIGFASILFTGKLIDKVNKKHALALTMFVLSIILIIPNITISVPVLVIFLISWGVLQSLIVTLLSTSLNESPQKYRGRVLAIYSLASNLAVTIGAGVMGPIYLNYGYSTVAIICSLITLIGMMVSVRLVITSKNTVTYKQLTQIRN